MNRSLFLCLLATAATVSGLASYSLEARSETFTLSAQAMINNFPLGLHEDLLIHSAFSDFPSNLAIRRRDQQGFYNLVGNYSAPLGAINPITNGKYVFAWTQGCIVWELKNNSLESGILFPDTPTSVKFFGDTLATLNSDADLIEYEFSNNESTWKPVQASLYSLLDPLSLSLPPVVNLAAPFQGNYFVGTSSTLKTVIVFERQAANNSWSVLETLNWSNYTFNSVGSYNGKDTVVVGFSPPGATDGKGYLSIFTKVDGKWQEQVVEGADLSIDPLGSFGSSVMFSNENTLWLSAPTDGQSMDSNRFGKIYVVTRNVTTGQWTPTTEFHSNDKVKFGMGVNLVDDYLVTIGCNSKNETCTLYSVPLCIMKPVNITCKDQEAKSCSEADLNSAYTIDNSNCEAVPVIVSNTTTNTADKMNVQFTFTRLGDTVTTCTVSCPIPPSAYPPSRTPRTSDSANVITSFLTIVILLVTLLINSEV